MSRAAGDISKAKSSVRRSSGRKVAQTMQILSEKQIACRLALFPEMHDQLYNAYIWYGDELPSGVLSFTLEEYLSRFSRSDTRYTYKQRKCSVIQEQSAAASHRIKILSSVTFVGIDPYMPQW